MDQRLFHCLLYLFGRMLVVQLEDPHELAHPLPLWPLLA
jgi:hypothetical protein